MCSNLNSLGGYVYFFPKIKTNGYPHGVFSCSAGWNCHRTLSRSIQGGVAADAPPHIMRGSCKVCSTGGSGKMTRVTPKQLGDHGTCAS